LIASKESLAGGLQRLDFLENRIEPLLELSLGAGLALRTAKAGVILYRLLVKSGGLHQKFALLFILGGHKDILIQLQPLRVIFQTRHEQKRIMEPWTR
jgi:hypothetical protein